MSGPHEPGWWPAPMTSIRRDAMAAHRYVIAHGAARTILARYLGVAGHAVHWRTGANGKPAFGGSASRWQWSLSRSGGHALLAVCLGTPIGVDLERVRDDIPEAVLASRFLPAEEAASVCAGRRRSQPPHHLPPAVVAQGSLREGQWRALPRQPAPEGARPGHRARYRTPCRAAMDTA